MTQNQKEWIINGALLAGIVLFVVLITLQKISESRVEVELPRSAAAAKTPATASATTATIVAAKGSLVKETRYQPTLEAGKSGGKQTSHTMTVDAAAYPNLGKVDIFRPLVTPPPDTPSPTPTAAPTPSLEKAVEGWDPQYRTGGRRGKPVTWVFKDPKQPNVDIEVTEGKPYTVTDPAGAGTFEIMIKQSDKYQVTIQYKDQEKTFSLR